jgi:sulfide dehydrogenase [flavocytochrome c] flavoprotein subunit
LRPCGLTISGAWRLSHRSAAPAGINTCNSYITAKEAVEVTGVYKVDKGAIVALAGSVGVSPDLSELEAVYAESWLKSILT